MDLRYPIGPYSPPSTIGRAELDAWIAESETLPGNLRNAVAGLRDDQLDKPYRPGGWTLRQVVHHIPDGHLSAHTFFSFGVYRAGTDNQADSGNRLGGTSGCKVRPD